MARTARRNRRKFEWARSAGAIATTNVAAQQVGRADLLASVRATYGNDFGRDATVVAVKGFVKPRLASTLATGTTVAGAAGIRTADAQDLTSVLQVTDAPSEPTQGYYYDWMWYQPWIMGPYNVPSGFSSGEDVGTSNIGASVWALDVRSNRTFESLGESLALYVGVNGVGVDVDFDYWVSIGLKLP
jgi:hypothetical protein